MCILGPLRQEGKAGQAARIMGKSGADAALVTEGCIYGCYVDPAPLRAIPGTRCAHEPATMHGLVFLILLSIAPSRAIAADTSIYIENVLWPHASQNAAPPVNEPRAAPRSEPARKSRGVQRP